MLPVPEGTLKNRYGTCNQTLDSRTPLVHLINSAYLCFSPFVDYILFYLDKLFGLARTPSFRSLRLLIESNKRLDLSDLPTSMAWSKLPEKRVLESLLDRQKQAALHSPVVLICKS